MLDPTKRDHAFAEPDDIADPNSFEDPDASADPATSNTDEDLTLSEEELSRRSGGPTTPLGKARSSRNAITHGCRSNTLIIPGEKQQDFDALHQRWMEAYEPDHDAALELVEQVILSKWYLLRNERRFNTVEDQLASFSFTKWNEGQHRIYQLALRYKTAAERTASKAVRDLEDYLKNRRGDEKYRQELKEEVRDDYFHARKDFHSMEADFGNDIADAAASGLDVTVHKEKLAAAKKRNRALLASMGEKVAALSESPAKTRAQLLFQGQHSPKKLRKISVLDQWIEVSVKDGVVTTQLTPSNEKLIERGQKMDPPPELVYRRLVFLNGVPDIYDWTDPNPQMKQYGGAGIQRMSVDTWLDVIDQEKLRKDGHIGPCGAPLPRPYERGNCDCPHCSRLRELLASPAPNLKPAA